MGVSTLPRINFEDEWFIDPRRDQLASSLGSTPLADGIALQMWRLAQHFYRNDQLIPFNQFDRALHSKEFEAAGLAERREDGVYIRGQEKHFDWLEKRRVAGRKGGQTSRPSKPKQTEANASKPKQMEPSYSSSYSPSYSISKTNTETQKSVCPFDLGEIAKDYPHPRGIPGGITLLSKEIRTEQDLADLKTAISNYKTETAGKELRYIKTFESFAVKWRDHVKPLPSSGAPSGYGLTKEFILKAIGGGS